MQSKITDFVGVYDGFFTPEWCDEVIKAFEIHHEDGLTKTRQELHDGDEVHKKDISTWTAEYCHAEAKFSGLRTVLNRTFNDVFWQKIYPNYAETYSALKHCDNFTIYENKVQKTNPGGGYHIWHFESAARAQSNRILTHILYLNDVEEGGETELLYLGKRIKPVKGRLVLFPAAFTHTHRGNPPLSGSKYIVTGWAEF